MRKDFVGKSTDLARLSNLLKNHRIFSLVVCVKVHVTASIIHYRH